MDQPIPSAPQLRPMSLSDMLDAAFRLYRKHFLTFVGIVALLLVPMAILQFLVQLPYAQALERFAAKAGQKIRRLVGAFQRKPRAA